MPTTKVKKQKSEEKQQLPSPLWAQELSEKYQSSIAHTFLLHGNVQDFVGGIPGLTLKNYLISSFAERDLVVTWNRATGLYLPTAAMRQKFAEIVEFPVPGQQPSTARSGFAAGLNQMAASAPTDIAKVLEKVRQPADALEYLNRLLRAKVTVRRNDEDVPLRSAVIIDYIESVAPASDAAAADNDRAALVMLSEWSKDVIGERGHLIILITNDLRDVNERLRKSAARWEQVYIPFPTFDERKDFAHKVVESNEVKLAADFTYDESARMTTGLRLIDVEDIVLRACFHETDVTRSLVKARKDEIVASEFDEVLQVYENEFGFEAIGGMEEVKADLRETVIEPMRLGQYRIVPQGLLLMGPAGTGKTRLAKALAKESGVTFVELQPSKIFIKWQGDTERRLERALSAITEMTPCIVFIDEIDQAINRGESGDNGTSNRVFKRLMEFMADTSLRGKVLWTCATNRPDLLDAALLRPGRMDKKIPVLAPDTQERVAILQVLTLQAFGDVPELPIAEDYQSLAEKMTDYTGAEIEGVIGKAFQLYARSKQTWSIAQSLLEAYERIMPTTGNIEQMTRLALLHCNDLDLVPVAYRELARQLRHPQARAELLDEQPDEIYQRGAKKRDW